MVRPYAGVSTVQTDAQIGPPMLNVAAARGFFTCSGAGRLAEQLPGRPADHRDAGRADRDAPSRSGRPTC